MRSIYGEYIPNKYGLKFSMAVDEETDTSTMIFLFWKNMREGIFCKPINIHRRRRRGDGALTLNSFVFGQKSLQTKKNCERLQHYR